MPDRAPASPGGTGPRPFAIAGVVHGSWGRLAIDVKVGRFAVQDLRNLGEFTQRFPAFRPLLLCRAQDVDIAAGHGLAAMSWQQFLLQGPAMPDAR